MCRKRESSVQFYLNSLQNNKNLSVERERESTSICSILNNPFLLNLLRENFNKFLRWMWFGWHLIESYSTQYEKRWESLKMSSLKCSYGLTKAERKPKRENWRNSTTWARVSSLFFILITFVTANLLHIKRIRESAIAQIHSIELHLGATSFSKLLSLFHRPSDFLNHSMSDTLC